MVEKRDPDRLTRMSEQWKVITLMALGGIGVLGCLIQAVVLPALGRPVNSTAIQWCMGMVLGFPIAGLLHSSTKREG